MLLVQEPLCALVKNGQDKLTRHTTQRATLRDASNLRKHFVNGIYRCNEPCTDQHPDNAWYRMDR